MTSSGPRPIEPVLLLDLEPGRFRYSVWRNLSIGIWANQATEEAARRVLSISRLMKKNHPGGHSNVVFVLDGAPPPTPEANAIFAKMYDAKSSGLNCMAIVVEGGGFWASGIRSAITSVRMSQPSALRMNVFDTVEEVLDWLPAEHNARTDVPITASELRAVLLQTRERAANDTGERALMASAKVD